MPESLHQLQKILPRSKFSPPHLDTSQLIVRASLIQDLSHGGWGKKRHLLLEAQAGQGKTTLAFQFLNNLHAPFAWYQVGPEDLDPIFFLSAIVLLLHECFPQLSGSQLEKRLLQGAISVSEVPFLADQLLAGIELPKNADFFIVLDDLHHLEKSGTCCQLIMELMKKSPANLHFILLTRRRIPIISECLRDMPQAVCLYNNEISFSKRETFFLSNDIFGLPLSPAEVAELHAVTEGWALGLQIWLKSADRQEMGGQKRLNLTDLSGFFPYFIDSLIADFPPEKRTLLLQLALLDEIPMTLAETLSDEISIVYVLETLVERNSFVSFYASEKLQGCYRFHNLFREALRGIGQEQIKAAGRKRFLGQVAKWYLHQEMPLTGLQYLVAAEDYETAQVLIRDFGFRLVFQNFYVTLKNILDDISESIFQNYPWFSLVYGIVLMELEPKRAYSFLQTANDSLRQTRDRWGELYALIQLITYHIAVDARYGAGSCLLPRAEKLFLSLVDDLDPFARVQIAPIIGLGYCLFDCNLEAARGYAEFQESDGRSEMVRFAAANNILHSYIHFFAGDTRGCLREIEKSRALVSSSLVNTFFTMYFRLFQLNYLSMSGDFVNYEMQKESLFRLFVYEHIASSLIGAFILLWDVDQALAEGRYEDAMDLVENAQGKDFAAASHHLRSQYLHYGAYLLALRGDMSQALSWARTSAELRDVAGGRYYTALNRMFIGAVYSLAGQEDKAEACLDTAVEEFRAMENDWMLPGALLHRAYFRLTFMHREEALEDMRQALICLRLHKYENFYGWEPEMMRILLTLAVKEGIEKDFCRELARTRLGMIITEKGEVFPCLSIRVLGPTEISLDGESVLSEPQLTGIQRRLLGLLVSAPCKQMSQEVIQDLLWPEMGLQNGRKCFDTSLYRLRRAIEKLSDPIPSRNFIQLQTGILYLKNCLIDMDVFKQQAHKGLKHFQISEYWQAGNAFYAAYHCVFRSHPATDSAARWATRSGANWASHSAVKWATASDPNWATFS